MDNKPIPYNTGKVLVGCYYSKPTQTNLTHEDRFWQDVLLGEYQIKRSQRRIWVAYVLVMVLVYVALALTLGGE